MVGKFPQIQFCSSESGTKSRSCAWEKYKYILPPAHILSCSLTAMVITSHMNGKQSGESPVPGNRVIKQPIRVELGKSSSAPMSTHLKVGDDLNHSVAQWQSRGQHLTFLNFAVFGYNSETELPMKLKSKIAQFWFLDFFWNFFGYFGFF